MASVISLSASSGVVFFSCAPAAEWFAAAAESLHQQLHVDVACRTSGNRHIICRCGTQQRLHVCR